MAALKARGQTGQLSNNLNQSQFVPEDQKKIPTSTGGPS
jgi:hypothetical protein